MGHSAYECIYNIYMYIYSAKIALTPRGGGSLTLAPITKCTLPHGFGEDGSSVFAGLYLPFEATTATISMYLSEEGTV